MKKLILTLVGLVFSISSALAWTVDAQGNFISDCGVRKPNCKPLSDFSDLDEARKFYNALNVELCGSGTPTPPSEPAPQS